MCREAISVPDGLITGPIFVNGRKMEGTADAGQALNIYPEAGGMQHCEIAGMRDTLDGFADKLPKWSWLRNLVDRQNWQTKIRDINAAGKVHPTVQQRFDLPHVVQCAAGVGPYRPEALIYHGEFERYYQPGRQGDMKPVIVGS